MNGENAACDPERQDEQGNCRRARDVLAARFLLDELAT
jgi:hypothetical protein